MKFWLKKLKQETTYVSVAMSQFSCKFFDTLFVFALLSVYSLPPLVQDCWEFETVTNWGRREKDKYAILLSSTCWLLLVTVLVCLVFLYSVFWIWNCDKLRLVREGQVCHSAWLYILVTFGFFPPQSTINKIKKKMEPS